jgi:pyrroline-5-carboxylate reductase
LGASGSHQVERPWSQSGGHSTRSARFAGWARIRQLVGAFGGTRERFNLLERKIPGMDAVGFIGCGRMGRTLLEALLDAGALEPSRVVVSTRTPARVQDLPSRHPGLRLVAENAEVARACDRIFLAVKPGQIRDVAAEIAPALRPGAHLLSLAVCVKMEVIARVVETKISRVIPTVAVAARAGVSLVCHDARVGPDDAAFVERLLAPVSEVMVVAEDELDASSTLTGAGPAFIATACREVARALTEASGIAPDRAERLVLATLYGSARLLWEKRVPADEVIDQVATRGGITEDGLRVLHRELPAVLAAVHQATSEKSALVRSAVENG